MSRAIGVDATCAIHSCHCCAHGPSGVTAAVHASLVFVSFFEGRRYVQGAARRPECAWVENLARQHGLDACLADEKNMKRLGARRSAAEQPRPEVPKAAGLTRISCLVVVENGRLGRGPLTMCPQEEKFSMMHQDAAGSAHTTFSLRIAKAFKFSEPLVSRCPARFFFLSGGSPTK